MKNYLSIVGLNLIGIVLIVIGVRLVYQMWYEFVTYYAALLATFLILILLTFGVGALIEGYKKYKGG